MVFDILRHNPGFCDKEAPVSRNLLPRRTTLFAALLISTLAVCGGCASTRGPQAGTASQPTSRPITSSKELQAALHEIFGDPKYSNAFWGVRVERPNGEVLYDHLANKGFTPASNMKLYTTAAALDILGADFKYETRVDAVGTITADGVLDGDLVIVGSGDPSLGAWHPDERRDSRRLLRRWTDLIREAGIKQIRGDIIGDGRCFTKEFYCPDWTYDDLVFWYGAGSSGLAIEENAFRVAITPGAKVGDPAGLSLTPATDYITLINETKTVAAGEKTTADSAWNQTEGNVKRIAGNIALDKKVQNERGSVWDGACYAAHLFREALMREGISVSGKAHNIRSLPDVNRIDKADASRRKTLITHTSPTLGEIAKVINKPSHNFFADQALRTLGLRKLGEGSYEAGAQVVREWLANIGAPQPDAFQMFDGSGLARGGFVQPRQTCHLLRYMRKSPAFRAFYDSLPIAGVDGTIESRMKAANLKGRLRAKTGYIGNVRSLSGYVLDAAGEELVFCFMCNKYTVPTSEVNATQDKAAETLARFRN